MVKKGSIKAVGYARRSTDLQERSIPDQQAYVERWAAENGYQVTRWYVDDAISGTSTRGREAFEKMIAAAENGRDFETVLCYDISRFSRGGTNETGFYLHRLKRVGVTAVFWAEGIPEGDEGELLQGVKSWQARQYSVKLSRDTIRGQISNIMERRCAPGGAPPYGYDKQHLTADGRVLRTFRWLADGRKEEYSAEGRLVRVLPRGENVKKARSDIVRYVPGTAAQVAVIQRIFRQSAEGYGSAYIAHRLNDDAIPSPDGATWGSNQIRKMLCNPAYRGALAWNKRTLGKLNGVGRDGKLRPRHGSYTVKANPKEDWFVVEDVHEPLITPKVWEQAHQAYLRRRGGGGRATTTNRALLSGLITCNHCGWNYGQRRTGLISGKRWRYYIDRGYQMGGRAVCLGTHVPADALDAWVISQVRQALLGDSEGIEAAIDAFVRQAMGGRKDDHDDGAAQRELDAISRRIKATVGMLTDPAFEGLDELKTTLADLKAKRDALATKASKAKPTAPTMSEKELRAWASERFAQLDKVLNGRATTLEARQVIHTYVDHIEIDPHHKRGVLYMPSDAYGCLTREPSTGGALGDARGGLKSKGEA